MPHPFADLPRALVVSLHDASPLTREPCNRILAELKQLGANRCSLLVIPDHHRRGHVLANAQFCEWLAEMSRQGHEIVIHGYYHERVRRPRETFAQRITTRVYTADEGEFFDISYPAAARLVEGARADFHTLGLETPGFIAPAWLLSREGEGALRDAGFAYTTRLGSITDFRGRRVIRSQSLVWSVRSGWRRIVSRAWNGVLFRALDRNPLMRVAIHPVDIAHPKIWRQICALISRALEDREPLTYQAWLARQRAPETVILSEAKNDG